MRSLIALAGMFGLLCFGCPEEGQRGAGYPPPPGYQQGQPPPPGYPPRPGYPPPAKPQPQYYPPGGYAMPQTSPGPQGRPPPQPGMPQPGQPGQPGQPAQPPPQPIAPLAPFGPPDPGGPALSIHVAHMLRARPALEQLAARNMVNLRPDGEPFAAQFNNGQIFEHSFEIIPGRCYGVVAVGMGITELDLALVLGEPPVDHVMGKDELKGPQAVIGASGKCISNPLPSPDQAKIVMTAVTGAGTAIAQIYSK